MSTTTIIKATYRTSIKIRDNFYTMEWCEERSVSADADIEEERRKLWNTCVEQVELQMEDIYENLKNPKK